MVEYSRRLRKVIWNHVVVVAFPLIQNLLGEQSHGKGQQEREDDNLVRAEGRELLENEVV